MLPGFHRDCEESSARNISRVHSYRPRRFVCDGTGDGVYIFHPPVGLIPVRCRKQGLIVGEGVDFNLASKVILEVFRLIIQG